MKSANYYRNFLTGLFIFFSATIGCGKQQADELSNFSNSSNISHSDSKSDELMTADTSCFKILLIDNEGYNLESAYQNGVEVPEQAFFDSQEQFSEFLEKHNLSIELPVVDFEAKYVYFIGFGEQTSSGYELAISGDCETGRFSLTKGFCRQLSHDDVLTYPFMLIETLTDKLTFTQQDIDNCK